MPKMVWTPTDGERHEYDFELADLLWAEVRAIQKVTGAAGLEEIGDMLDAADGTAIPAFLWVLRKREEPELPFAALESLKIGEVEFKRDEDEVEDESEAGKEETTPPPAPPAEPQPAAEEPPYEEPRVRLAT